MCVCVCLSLCVRVKCVCGYMSVHFNLCQNVYGLVKKQRKKRKRLGPVWHATCPLFLRCNLFFLAFCVSATGSKVAEQNRFYSFQQDRL